MTSFEHNQEYQFIIEQSKQLHKTEHIEIFKIIDNNIFNIEYIFNKFFSLS